MRTSKLTPEDITDIQEMRKSGIPAQTIAQTFDISEAYVCILVSRSPKGFTPDPPKKKTQRPPSQYSNISREQYVERALKERV